MILTARVNTKSLARAIKWLEKKGRRPRSISDAAKLIVDLFAESTGEESFDTTESAFSFLREGGYVRNRDGATSKSLVQELQIESTLDATNELEEAIKDEIARFKKLQ